jgi:hypothetical protein
VVKKLGVVFLVLLVAVPASAAKLPILADRDWWPVFSPDGARVAFTRVNGQGRLFTLYTVKLASRRVTKVGQSASQLSPAWSSDSAKIAYSSGGVLYTASAAGSVKHRYPAPAKALSPAWRPRSTQLAYVASGELRVGGAVWAKGVIGKPAWSPDGTQLAYARETGIFVATGPAAEQQLATTTTEPGSPVFSPDGTKIAYAENQIVFVGPADGSSSPVAIAKRFTDTLSPLGWTADGKAVTTTDRLGLFIVSLDGTLAREANGGGVGVAASPKSSVLAYSGSLGKSCPAHIGIDLQTVARTEAISGTCSIGGTTGADVIYGTPREGDVIVARAGNDRIHVNDGHTDRVLCGPGRDTVWADRNDTLSGCEIIHR